MENEFIEKKQVPYLEEITAKEEKTEEEVSNWIFLMLIPLLWIIGFTTIIGFLLAITSIAILYTFVAGIIPWLGDIENLKLVGLLIGAPLIFGVPGTIILFVIVGKQENGELK